MGSTLKGNFVVQALVNKSLLGIEPRISCFVGRRLIHLATGTGTFFKKEFADKTGKISTAGFEPATFSV